MENNTKERVFRVKPIHEVSIGDPHYFEQMDSGIDVKKFQKCVFELIRKEPSKDIAELRVIKDGEDLYILSFRQYISPKYFGTGGEIQEPEYTDLGCDTARFSISIDGREDTIHTGSDGLYGEYGDLYLKTKASKDAIKIGFIFNIVLDSDFWSISKLNELIHYLWK